MNIQTFKESFKQSKNYILLNNAGLSATSLPAVTAVHNWIDRFAEDGDRCFFEVMTEVDRTRESLARFLGAEKKTTAFFSTTAAALSQVALGIPLSSGDEVMVWDQEYPSNFYPWKVAADR